MRKRYAIYFAPGFDTALWQFGCSAIGYDASSGNSIPLPRHPAYDHPDARTWVSEPARYGFHATLKAPFELADGLAEQDLFDAAASFARQRTAFLIPALTVRLIGQFLALAPSEPSARLSELAGDCVTAFEPFRAPLSANDLRRRLKAPLTPRQITHVDRWGYPYVFDDFRFHMTLTGALDDVVSPQLKNALDALYRPLAGPVPIDGLAIFRQNDRAGNFRVLERFRFAG
jgi:putative phosphonate metabolism protein